MKEDAHLVGNEYSTLSSIAPYAQIGARPSNLSGDIGRLKLTLCGLAGFQPLGAYLLVKIKPKTLVPSLVALWGASLMGMGGANSFGVRHFDFTLVPASLCWVFQLASDLLYTVSCRHPHPSGLF